MLKASGMTLVVCLGFFVFIFLSIFLGFEVHFLLVTTSFITFYCDFFHSPNPSHTRLPRSLFTWQSKLTYRPLLDTERTKILQWLSEVEYQKHHWNAKEGRIDRTGEWLLRRQEFQEWQVSSVSTILWLHGIRK